MVKGNTCHCWNSQQLQKRGGKEEKMKTTLQKLLTTFCLAIVLALSAPTLAATLGITPGASVAQAASGWGKDENGRYYMHEDKRVTGLAKIKNVTYYFDKNGYCVSGPVRLGKAVYYFRLDNYKLLTGKSGMVRSTTEKNTYYYFSPEKNGKLVTSQWVRYKGKYYYADVNGRIKLGTIKVGGKLYHVTAAGRMTKYGKSSVDNKYYYADSNGVLRTGIQKIGKYGYYFSKTDGSRISSGRIDDSTGTYFINKKTGRAKTGWLQSKGNSYYFGSDFRKVSGFKTISKKLYYFDPKQNNACLKNGWHKIGSSYYYMDKKGVIQTGLFKVGNYTYYANNSGARQKGWQTISGKKYYFDSKTSRMKTGWLTYKKQKYYLNPSKSSASYGAAMTGFVKISGSWYYFNSNGTMKTGWLTENLKKYYFDLKTGKMYTGKHTIDGTTYDFGSSGAITVTPTGAWSIQVNRRQCFVVVYRGNTPVKAFVCSTAADGVSTPTGYFSLLDKLYWHELNGPSWGQYCSHITSDILFHSVPCNSYNNPYSLPASLYNQLGSPASHGCIRLSVKHAKWLFYNCPRGTSVYISDYVAKPTGITIETTPKIPSYQTYDPTDDFSNPYNNY